MARTYGHAFDGVEVVDVSVIVTTCCEHVTAVAEFNFTAILYRYLRILLNGV